MVSEIEDVWSHASTSWGNTRIKPKPFTDGWNIPQAQAMLGLEPNIWESAKLCVCALCVCVCACMCMHLNYHMHIPGYIADRHAGIHAYVQISSSE